jgi:hypothetical protein
VTTPALPILPRTGSYLVAGAGDGGALRPAGFAAHTTGRVHVLVRATPGRGRAAGPGGGRPPVTFCADACAATRGTLGDPPLYAGEHDRPAGRWVVGNDRFAAAALLCAWAAEDGVMLSPEVAVERVHPLPGALVARWHRTGGVWHADTHARPLGWAPERAAGDPAAATARVVAELQHGVARWASASARPVVLLSGGVDSGLVAAFAHAANPRTVALNLGTPWGSELEGATATAEHVGVPLEHVRLTEQELCARVEETQAWLQRGEAELCLVQLMITIARSTAAGLGDVLMTGMGSDLLNAPNDVGMETGPAGDAGDPLATLVARVRDASGTGLFFSGRHHPLGGDGLPVAFPFWEPSAIHAQLAVPAVLKEGEGYEKHYLRKLAERFLPAEVAWGRKYAIHQGGGLAENLSAALARRDPGLGDEPLSALWQRTIRRRVVDSSRPEPATTTI